MAKLIIVARDGTETEIEGKVDLSVMENIRDAGYDELLAICGGCMSCATCHVHVDPEWLDVVGAPEGEEVDLLDSSDDRDETSRLSCQIKFLQELDGLRVRIAKED